MRHRPAGTRWTVVPALGAAVALHASPDLSDPSRSPRPSFHVSVDVARVLTRVRVIDRRGEPVLGLESHDFRVRIGGRAVDVEAVDWVTAAAAAPPKPAAAPAPVAAAETAASGGRRIVILFQKDHEPSRLSGLYRMSSRARKMVAGFHPQDRVAVLVFGTHLQLHADFSNDFASIAEELRVTRLLQSEQATDGTGAVTLTPHYDVEAARDAATMSAALKVVADALAPIPGPKDILLFGWGIGRFTPNGVVLSDEYDEAQRALVAAGATVFAMDITDADYHSLEFGLRAVAEDTGGFYRKTHLHPEIAMRQLRQALAGHYVLTLIKPDIDDGKYRLQVDLEGRSGQVYAPPELVLSDG